MANSRDNARRGETVRLYARFFRDDLGLADPYSIDSITISGVDVYVTDISPTHESLGSYYIEWNIPSGLDVGYYSDIWEDVKHFSYSDPIDYRLTFAVLYSSNDEITIPEDAIVESGLCRVYDFFATPDGEPLEGVEVYASLVNLPYVDSGYIYVNDEEAVKNYTNANGRANWDITQGANVHFRCPEASYSKVKKIPFVSTGRVSDLEDSE